MSGYDRVVQPAAGDEALENHLGGEEAKNYRRYEFDTVAPHVGRSLLEIGSGLGDFAEQFLPRLDRLVVSDFDPYCVEQLRKRFADRSDVDVLQFGLPTEIPLAEPVDTVVMMNVLEHIEEDVEALKSLARVVQPGGRIVIWVPGYMQLYGDFDRKVGHVTRYTPKTLRATVEAAGLRPQVLKPINFLGGLAWWVAVRKGGVGYPDPRLVKIYDRTVVPTTRFIEKLITPPFGQTVFCVARVPA
ncbi:class I SAM-dependent methyltransferase [Bailinhaonella thermotolerans]|uniref:SAM-dependent methyltransferase n=1 Tax=Bailinhaonella thermotolerans TaxID=1070861 RepID=A0A3A4AY12_9ACTN|nr:methyltransferase [Bailinhaonella thermotolerans]RJL30767.1 SAM-dependent methyltransferase [Bailinhaonella thermotolerans]